MGGSAARKPMRREWFELQSTGLFHWRAYRQKKSSAFCRCVSWISTALRNKGRTHSSRVCERAVYIAKKEVSKFNWVYAGK